MSSKIIDEPETKNWSDKDLRKELINCSTLSGQWALISFILGNKKIFINKYLYFQNIVFYIYN